MRLSNKVILASTNPDKLNEFRALFQSYPEIEIVSADLMLRNANKLAFVEKFATYQENAVAKARLANQGSHYPCLADDTGLEVSALQGRPGPRSFRYAQVPGRTLSRLEQNRANIELLLSEMQGKTDRSARFVTSLAICMEGILVHVSGELTGQIADEPRGDQGFGYDSVFIPEGSTKTLGEMTEAEKNSLSHRAKAVHELMRQVRLRGIVLAKP